MLNPILRTGRRSDFKNTSDKIVQVKVYANQEKSVSGIHRLLHAHDCFCVFFFSRFLEKVWKLIRITIKLIYVGQGLRENKVLHRHVCIVFLPNPPTAILELPNCLSHEWLTFLKRWFWLVRQEYNKHVTTKVLISA